jgi:hypothetical protein
MVATNNGQTVMCKAGDGQLSLEMEGRVLYQMILYLARLALGAFPPAS